MRLVPIVEGHGEYEAVPVLLRRLAAELGTFVEVVRPIRRPKSQLVREPELRRAVKLAGMQSGQGDAILVLLDADADCPATTAPSLLGWATSERSDRSIAVVLAKREFEAWFLAATPSLIAAGKLAPNTKAPPDPEAIADPKGWLSQAMGRRYSETIDQPTFAASFDLIAARNCKSFDKLVRDVERLLAAQ